MTADQLSLPRKEVSEAATLCVMNGASKWVTATTRELIMIRALEPAAFKAFRMAAAKTDTVVINPYGRRFMYSNLPSVMAMAAQSMAARTEEPAICVYVPQVYEPRRRSGRLFVSGCIVTPMNSVPRADETTNAAADRQNSTGTEGGGGHDGGGGTSSADGAGGGGDDDSDPPSKAAVCTNPQPSLASSLCSFLKPPLLPSLLLLMCFGAVLHQTLARRIAPETLVAVFDRLVLLYAMTTTGVGQRLGKAVLETLKKTATKVATKGAPR